MKFVGLFDACIDICLCQSILLGANSSEYYLKLVLLEGFSSVVPIDLCAIRALIIGAYCKKRPNYMFF